MQTVSSLAAAELRVSLSTLQPLLSESHPDRELSLALTHFRHQLSVWEKTRAISPLPPPSESLRAVAAPLRALPHAQTTEQYVSYPYPERDPVEEREVLRLVAPGNLLELNHSLWLGRRNFALPLRVLVAGGGTGDTCVGLAQHLHDLEWYLESLD